ncbi:MAG: nucleotide exchange factor GrpE [Clostridia bacterium]|nr:nucleotide exchange factor GrpE [Clostridia bacterium]
MNKEETMQNTAEEPTVTTESGTAEAEAVQSEKTAGGRRDGKKTRAEIAELEKKLKEAEEAAAEAKDKYLRVLAEYDNFRKRSAKERDGIYADAVTDSVMQLLPLLDNLKQAREYADGDPAKVVEGVRMILASVPEILGKMDVTEYGAPGDTFDPNIHNAVLHVEDDEHGEGEIVEVFQSGYRRGDKIIRYAMVRVAN